MGEWVNFKQLRSRLRFAAVLDHYGVKLNRKGDQAQGFCPLPDHKGEGRSPSFSVNLPRGIWQCFGCGASGNVLDFAVRMEGKSTGVPKDVRSVALLLQERFQLTEPTQRKESNARGSRREHAASEDSDHPLLETMANSSGARPEQEVRINAPLDFRLKGLQPEHPYLRKRGFTAKTIDKFGLGYCPRGLMAGRVAIPIYNTDSRLVGYAGRVVDDLAINADNPKYKFPSRRERDGIVYEFRKSHLLYNADRIKGTADHLVVVEGFPSVWWIDQAGISNVVALMGSSCSAEQAAIVLSKTTATSRITVLPDGDEAGSRCANSFFEALASRRWLRWCRLPDGKQPTDLAAEELKRVFAS